MAGTARCSGRRIRVDVPTIAGWGSRAAVWVHLGSSERNLGKVERDALQWAPIRCGLAEASNQCPRHRYTVIYFLPAQPCGAEINLRDHRRTLERRLNEGDGCDVLILRYGQFGNLGR